MKEAIGFKEKTVEMVNNILKLDYGEWCTFLKINEKSLAKKKKRKKKELGLNIYYIIAIWSGCLTSGTMNYLSYKLGLLKLGSKDFYKYETRLWIERVWSILST